MSDTSRQLGDATAITVPLGVGAAMGSISAYQARNEKMRLVVSDPEDAVSLHMPVDTVSDFIRVLIARSGRTDMRLVVNDVDDVEDTAEDGPA